MKSSRVVFRRMPLSIRLRRSIDGRLCETYSCSSAKLRILRGVEHYYPTKAELRDAVDRYVLQVTASTYSDMPSQGTTVESRVEEVGKRVTALFRDRPLGHRYVARGLVDRDERALQMFDALVRLVGRLVREDISEGRMPADIDETWATLHTLVFHFGVVLLEHAINRQLPEPLRTEAGLERWRSATSALYRHGLYRSDE